MIEAFIGYNSKLEIRFRTVEHETDNVKESETGKRVKRYNVGHVCLPIVRGYCSF